MTMTAMLAFIQELQKISETADREKLAVWYPQFMAEFPEFAVTIEKCVSFKDSRSVLPYLKNVYPMLDLATKIMPIDWTTKLEQSILFLHQYLNERKQLDGSKSNPRTAGLLRNVPNQ